MPDQPPESNNHEEQEEPQEREITGFDELLYSLGQSLRSKEGKNSVARLIQAFADDVERRSKIKSRTLLYGYLLSAIIFVVIGIAGYLKIISAESTGTLFAALLGYLFYQRRQ